MSDELKELKERNKLLKEEIRLLKRAESVGGSKGKMGFLSKIIPKGIRHPDSVVKNRDLYIPRRRNRQ